MAGKIQNEDIKSVAELTGAGGTAAQLPNDDKTYVTANSINKTLKQAIIDGDIGGGGGGGFNFLSAPNSKFASSVGDWITFDDGAVSAPIDGTGGSPSAITISRVTTFDSAGGLQISHSAASAQGEGASVAFSVEPKYRGAACSITGVYKTSAPYLDDQLECWLYDVTNSQLIQPAPYKLKAAIGGGKFKFEFQTSATGASYRLIFFCPNTTATAYTVDVDDIAVGPTVYNYGLVGTTPVRFTPTGSFTTNTTYTASWYRKGHKAIYEYQLAFSGAPNSVSCTLDLFPGHVIDTTSPNGILDNTSNRYRQLGTCQVGDNFNGEVGYNTGTNVYLYSQIASGDARQDNVTQAQPITLNGSAGTNYIIARFEVPILGWSSNVQMSDEADLRVVAAAITSSGTVAVSAATNTKVTSLTVVTKDTHAAWDTSTQEYRIPSSGWYEFTPTITGANQARTAADRTSIYIYKNGSQQDIIDTRYIHASLTVRQIPHGTYRNEYAAGDLISFYYFNAASDTVDGASVSIAKVQGPSAIAASEVVNAYYRGATGTLNTSFNKITYGTVLNDTHGSYVSGTYTAKKAGFLDIAAAYLASGTMVTGAYSAISIYKNGAELQTNYHYVSGAQGNVCATIGVNGVPVNAGDTIEIYGIEANITGSAYNTDVKYGFVSIIGR